MNLFDLYKQWCKNTKRNGGILVGSSIRELLEYLTDELKKDKLTNN